MAEKKKVAKRPAKKQPAKSGRKNTRSNSTQPRVLSSEVTLRAPIFYITSDKIVEPSGVTVRRDIVRHPGSVVIIPLDETTAQPRLLLGKQFRYAAMQDLWEFPAGRVDEGEDLLVAAKRELEEETGYSAREWMPALFFYSSPGFLDEQMHVWLARDLVKGKARPEEDEFITHKFYTVDQAKELVMAGKIQDAKTVAGILWVAEKYTPRKK